MNVRERLDVKGMKAKRAVLSEISRDIKTKISQGKFPEEVQKVNDALKLLY